jgi:hypothetical protein
VPADRRSRESARARRFRASGAPGLGTLENRREDGVLRPAAHPSVNADLLHVEVFWAAGLDREERKIVD